MTIQPAQSLRQMRPTNDPALAAILGVEAFASVSLAQAHAQLISDQLDVLEIPLGDGRTVEAHKLSYRTNLSGQSIWRGEIAESGARAEGGAESEVPVDEQNSVILVRDAEQITGSIRVGGELYRILPLRGGGQIIVKVDASKQRSFGEEHDHGSDVIRSELPPETVESTVVPRARDGISTIRVMIVATPLAVDKLGGGTSGLQALGTLALEESNQSFINSGISARFESAGTYILDYRQEALADSDLLLDKIESRSDQELGVPVWKLRDEHRADLVVLLADIRSYCGMATLNASKATAYGVVAWECLSGDVTFQHEIGHNIGADHTPEEAQGNAFPYGSGHLQDSVAPRWSTIMAPSCRLCAVLNYWSNPYRTYHGLPMGVVNVSDNARVWALRAPVVANFYPDPVAARPPDAVAHAQPSAVVGEQEVRLDGAQSSDPEGGTLSYRWEHTGGAPEVRITGSSSKIARARIPAVGRSSRFTFRLTVTNSHELSDSHEVTVTAEPLLPPDIVINGATSVRSGDPVTLDASGSSASNPGASPLQFEWALPSGIAEAVIDGAFLRFTAPTVPDNRLYRFEVTASDGKVSASKPHTLTVTPRSGGGEDCIPSDPSAAQYPRWDTLKTYVGGDTVQYNGVVWRAGWSTRGVSPDKVDAFSLLSNLPVPWQAGRPYVAGNQVIHEGKLYQAKYWVNTKPPGIAWALLGDHACP
ncbi:PKD domain-containing protein [Pseudomonas sp. FEN]|uniref:PKD domain-containing protein n=1 Tax=Pseudomonas sp. FEN TaxID=2767468 RepID=UPI001CD44F85|nr:carbohydrate-binding protein [Pseudomonas sp. FEN]